MHILPTTSASLDDLVEPVDLAQSPADIVALSFTDSDLAAIASAWRRGGDALPSMRLAPLRDLRHPMSVDLWIEKAAAQAKVILARILGGYDWWRYGCDQLAALARAKNIRLALLPGECREQDERLVECSTLPRADLDELLALFREGSPGNMDALVRRLAGLARGEDAPAPPVSVPKAGFYESSSPRERGEGKTSPVVPILFYRSMLLADDVAPIDALCEALAAKDIRPVPIFVSSLKDSESVDFVEAAVADLNPAAIVTATAFAVGAEPSAETLFDRAGVPVFQVMVATTRRDAWEKNPRGLAPADLAMHVVMPELDGRVLAGAISFKAQSAADQALGFIAQANTPEPDRVEQVAARIAAFLRLAATPREKRRLAVLIPDYPSAPGRTGYAVGLDVPASMLAMLHDLKNHGYSVDSIPESPRALLDLLEGGGHGLPLADYRRMATGLPIEAMATVEAAWGDAVADAAPSPSPLWEGSPIGRGSGSEESSLAVPPPRLARLAKLDALADPPHKGEGEGAFFPFRATTFGNITVALAPDRGRSADRRADYHDAALPPRHALVAFGLWLRQTLGVHALVHVGAHGTLEWLPGKTVALSQNCFPEIVTGALPVIYPFIVSNPGEAAQAKRRIAAITLGHLPPPMTSAGLDVDKQRLERLVDEYAQADGLDRRRRDRLAKLIVDTAAKSGLAAEAGVANTDAPDEALRRIDAWLCDLKDFAVKDGLHVYGRAAPDEADPLRLASAEAERENLLAALDGRHVRA
ncbi:cobaltochelatase subunit CobN, partial [Mesorhizobium sp. IMUNJ 23232]|uniref:cobaltochelatase subunit CobN n=1 Tax=Mesorhizobium sp. IMUNJ 23232 TaxID=3376064 RepID=UPI003796ED28